MGQANELFYWVIAITFAGLFFGSLPLAKLKKEISILWPATLALMVVTYSLYALAPGLVKTVYLFTYANAALLGANLFLWLIFRSWNSKPKPIQFLVIGLILLGFILFASWFRHIGSFPARTYVVVIPVVMVMCAQLWEMHKAIKISKSIQLQIFAFTTILEIILFLSRVVSLYINDQAGMVGFQDETPITTALRWIRCGFMLVTFISLDAYFSEQVFIENRLKSEENKRINELLKEKERLIYGLLKANKTAATGALSASIAHELNQPLGASSLNIQFLKMKLEKGVLNPGLGKEILDSLEQDNKRAAAIVQSLRSIFTEGNSNSQEIELGDLITRVLDIVNPELKSKNIQIQLSCPNVLMVRVNAADIEQVILNLINNSMQSLANSGTLQRRIAIEAFKDGQTIHLTIADNGPGVSEEFKPQLFELLSTTKQSGMGLGLWLCKHIVTRYMGTIEYEDALNGGAKFLIRLPAVG